MIDRGRWRRQTSTEGGLLVDPWSVIETRLDLEGNAARESLFSVGNGYIGIRGTFEEGAPDGARSVPGTYLNGFHERGMIAYPEDAYGLARESQTMLNVIDGSSLSIWLDDERVSLDASATEYARSLDFRTGVLERTYVWRGTSGRRARLRFLRAVSLCRSHRAALRLVVEPLDGEMALRVCHALNGRVENQVERGDPRVGTSLAGQVLQPANAAARDGRLLLQMRAPISGMEVVCAASYDLSGVTAEPTSRSAPLSATNEFSATIGNRVQLDVSLVYLDSRHAKPSDLARAGNQELDEYSEDGGVSNLLERQHDWLEEFWASSDVEVGGDDAVQQSLRFSLFHLVQGAGRDGKTNIASKALTGEGYEGHTFWDSEVYVVPVLTLLRPDLARPLLEYRVAMLPMARRRAEELHRPGALYPWRTIAGPEASAYFPAGTAQIHIDADVALAFERYLEATGDLDLMWGGGAEVVLECARFYANYGDFGADGYFHLHTVTGPDEYTALVDDNHFTNKMARQTLRFAVSLAEVLRTNDSAAFAQLASQVALTETELARFGEIAERLYLPVDSELAITPQDSSFLGKPEWPWESVTAERYPLLLNYHPLDIYRHQVLKQADVLLAHHLLPQDVPRWRLRRDADYYSARTTHDSSLSACAHAIIAAELGLMDSAIAFFDATSRTDLDDLQGNTEHGVHVAAMGGAWLTIAHGFGGFRAIDGTPTFRPRLPSRWRRLRLAFTWRSRQLEMVADHDITSYRLKAGEPLRIAHRGHDLVLAPGVPVSVPTRPRLRGVIFDLDGVITDSAELHYLAWQELADELRVPFDRAVNEQLRGIDRMNSLERILARSDRSFSESEKHELARRKNDSYVRLIEGVSASDVLPGVQRLLDELKQAGLPLALASASRNAPTLLERLALTDRFAVVIDPAVLERGKPDPEIFERAAAELGVETDECVGIEDAAAGVEAIVGANMAAVGVGPKEALGAAHRIVTTTAELSLALLEEAHAQANIGYFPST